ncbi:hypothetical protein FQN52_008129 [Onygenales sp. PD_12]|nr:hypothetical protein FQN52_008129 [Onygenales sp. PD_12]
MTEPIKFLGWEPYKIEPETRVAQLKEYLNDKEYLEAVCQEPGMRVDGQFLSIQGRAKPLLLNVLAVMEIGFNNAMDGIPLYRYSREQMIDLVGDNHLQCEIASSFFATARGNVSLYSAIKKNGNWVLVQKLTLKHLPSRHYETEWESRAKQLATYSPISDLRIESIAGSISQANQPVENTHAAKEAESSIWKVIEVRKTKLKIAKYHTSRFCEFSPFASTARTKKYGVTEPNQSVAGARVEDLHVSIHLSANDLEALLELEAQNVRPVRTLVCQQSLRPMLLKQKEDGRQGDLEIPHRLRVLTHRRQAMTYCSSFGTTWSGS